MEADKEMLERNAHISDEEILHDIEDTTREIAEMEIEAEHLEQTPLSMRDARWDHMRASARRTGIAERKEFVAKLQKLYNLRHGN